MSTIIPPTAFPQSAPQPAPEAAPQDQPQESQAALTAGDPLTSVMDAMDFSEAARQLEAEQTQRAQQEASQQSTLGWLSRVTGDAAGAGVDAAGYELKDLLFGEPNYEDKSAIRKADEAFLADLRRTSTVGSISASVGQFVAGLAVTPSVKAAGLAGWGLQALRGAAIGATVFDPHQDRLSNLVQQFPALQNPVTEFLAAKPDDSDAMGRFKSALEGLGMDAALSSAFALGAKAMKLRAAGDIKAATAATDEARTILNEAEAAKPSDAPEITVSTAPDAPQATPQAEGTVKLEAEPQVSSGEQTPKASPDVSPPPPPTEPLAPEQVSKLVELSDQSIKGSSGQAQAAPDFINWNKVAGPEDVKAYTQQVVDTLAPRIQGDVLTDANVRSMVQARATAFNEDPQALLATLWRKGADAKQLAADMEASYVVANGLFRDTYSLAQKIKSGLLDEFGGDRGAAMQELGKRAALASDTLASAKAMSSASGQALRRMRSEFKITPDMLEQLKGKRGEALVMALDASGGDPALMSRALSPGLWRSAQDEAGRLLVNGVLSWYPSHVMNALGNLYMLAARPTEKVLGSLFLGEAGKPVRAQALREYRGTISALSDGWDAAKQAFMDGDSKFKESLLQTDGSYTPIPLNLKPITSVDSLLHNALQVANWKVATGLPTRLLGSVDEMVKTIRYRAVVQARSSVEAEAQGFTGQDAMNYIKQRMNAAFDEQGHALDGNAMLEAQQTTLSTPLLDGTLGKTISNAVADQPLLRTVFTFLRSPTNAVRYGIRMTPGLQFAQQEFRDMLRNADPAVRAQAAGQMTLGMLWIGAIYPFANAGMITGGGPNDPQLRQQLTANGWKPYSFVYEDGQGTKHYFPIGRLDPPGLLIGMIADAHDLMQHPDTFDKGTDIAQAAGVALLKNIGNRTFLQSLDQAVRAFRDPENSLPKWIGQQAGNLLPYSALLRGSNPDPYMREARTFADNIMQNVPGYSTTMEPRYDALGQPIVARRGLWSDDSGPNIVRRELDRITLETGKGLTPATPVKDSGIDLRDYQLPNGRSAYAQMNEYIANPPHGKPLMDELERLMKSKAYRTSPDGDGQTKGTKLYLIGRLVFAYRDAAWRRLLSENKDLRDASYANVRQAKAAHQKLVREQSATPADKIIGTLGVGASQ